MPAETIGYSQLELFIITVVNFMVYYIILYLCFFVGLRGKVPHSSLGGNKSIKLLDIMDGDS